MTAHELAQKLLEGPDLPVHLAYNYGDYWKTQVAPQVLDVEQGRVEYSEYHRMDRVVQEEPEDGETYRAAIILS